ncbi:hypothetical protein B0H65DRAFT_555325 [Neurospora tetraspora]|uniref:Uncharacterized protein n=1 Tax=Neurospora tetraspora TaxID=94610 RepID=A0AAE0MWY9_9PEZI|nr:hypothetical protein B0H65DRAFT_555325 [Neurospora tetraspora]
MLDILEPRSCEHPFPPLRRREETANDADYDDYSCNISRNRAKGQVPRPVPPISNPFRVATQDVPQKRRSPEGAP